MDAIRSQFNKPWVIGLAGLVLGLIIGLLWGYVISPVEWYDAAVYHLRADLQEDYLRMAVDSNTLRPDALLANKRFKELGEGGPTLLQKLQSAPGVQGLDAINKFNQDASAGVTSPAPGVGTSVAPQAPAATTAVQPAGTSGAPLPGQGTTQPTGETKEKTGNPLLTLLMVMCGITLVLGLGLAAVYVLRTRKAGPSGPMTPAQQANEAARQAQWTDYETGGEEPPMAQFMASYKLGDDLFDDSFSVDSATGEFMGECGVGISETIGVGDPKKVTAMEVWLFDKNDIQTVTKVLMSAHAFQDDSIRQRLAAKGEPVLTEPAGQAVLETATLRLVAKIVDMNYGEGALPEKSFFDNLILEIAVWPK